MGYLQRKKLQQSTFRLTTMSSFVRQQKISFAPKETQEKLISLAQQLFQSFQEGMKSLEENTSLEKQPLEALIEGVLSLRKEISKLQQPRA